MTAKTAKTPRVRGLGRRAAILTAVTIGAVVATLIGTQIVMTRSAALQVSLMGKQATVAMLSSKIVEGDGLADADAVAEAVRELAAFEGAGVAFVSVVAADGAQVAAFSSDGEAPDFSGLDLSGGIVVGGIENYSVVGTALPGGGALHVAWSKDEINHQTLRGALIGGAVGVLIAVFGIVLAIRFLNRAIVSPVEDVTDILIRLADGDHSVEAPKVSRDDEIAAMARAVEEIRKGAIERDERARDAEQARASADAVRAEAEERRNAEIAEQGAVVSALAEALSRLSAGDVRHRLETAFPAEYEELRENYNTALDALQSSLIEIADNADAVTHAAGSISTASADLSSRTESQAASLEESAAAITEISATTQKTADGASHAAEVVGRAKSEAEQGGAVVRDAVGAMSEIESSSEKIGEITGVIDEIAFQTNLLALNAGVEAARAGEAGKGFAVVAQEVRALAQRSADAAKQIKDLIQSSKEQVERGVKLVDGAGDALGRIISGVGDINSAVAEITDSAREQANGLREVSGAVSDMDHITQKNAAMVEQVTRDTADMSRQADAFAALLQRFETGRVAKARPAPVTAPTPEAAPAAMGAGARAEPAAPAKPAPAPIPASSSAPAPRPAAPAPRPAAPSRAAAAAAPVASLSPEPSEGGWEEF